jgi:hypothetical protein
MLRRESKRGVEIGSRNPELKPLTQSSLKGFKTQLRKWYGNGTVEDGQVVQLWGYDQQGNIMSSGRNFSFDPVNGLTQSIVPGYGTTPPPLIVPNLLWGGGAGAFTSTTYSNQVQSGNGCGQK